MKGTAAIVLTLLALLGAAAGVAWWVWQELGTVAISPKGWIALGAGVSATILLGVGLMFLVYFSHRRGYDDRVGKE